MSASISLPYIPMLLIDTHFLLGPMLILAVGLSVLAVIWHRTMTSKLRERSWALEAELRERRRVERKLVESERLYRMLVETTHSGFGMDDRDGFVVFVNDTLCQMLGYPVEEIIGRPLSDFFDWSCSHKLDQVQPLRKQGIHSTYEVIFVRRDDTRMPAIISGSPVFDDEGQFQGSFGVVTDLTHQKQMESQLAQAQKMEALGTLAGGIAHDFNNILAAILGYTELAARIPDLPDDLSRPLGQVHKAVDRAKSLIRQILSFSRLSPQDQEPLHLIPVLEEAVSLLRASLPASIDLQAHYHTQQDVIRAEPSKIHQLILNLGTNAAQAMIRESGSINISLTRTHRHSQPELNEGNYLCLAITDNGSGMDKSTQSRIFEPFFTTKSSAEGTGIGLTVVHGIVKNHAGAIEVESSPGEGTTFSIYLPQCHEPVANINQRTHSETGRGHERILLVDDEESLVETGTLLLEDMGYHVHGSLNPKEALALFEADPDQFDMLVTDMTLPEMTGAEMAERMMSIKPQLPVILCTGYSAVIDEARAQRMGIKSLLLKPFKFDDLNREMRRIFDGASV